MLFLKNNLLTLSGIGIMEQLVLTYLVPLLTMIWVAGLVYFRIKS